MYILNMYSVLHYHFFYVIGFTWNYILSDTLIFSHIKIYYRFCTVFYIFKIAVNKIRTIISKIDHAAKRIQHNVVKFNIFAPNSPRLKKVNKQAKTDNSSLQLIARPLLVPRSILRSNFESLWNSYIKLLHPSVGYNLNVDTAFSCLICE